MARPELESNRLGGLFQRLLQGLMASMARMEQRHAAALL
jgi:hypothetical protein